MKNFSLTNFNNFPSKFVDRTEIRDIILHECEHRIQKNDYFKVIAIYGIGGIGKTKLIEKVKETINNSQYKRKILHISFEIGKNRQNLDNLIKIRKAFGKRCCLFDYTLLLYWEHNRSERLNDDFMAALKCNLITDMADMITSLTGTISAILPLKPNIPSIPAMSDIFDLVNAVISKIPDNYCKRILQEIPRLTDTELLENMPLYLGMDILRQTEKEPEEPTVFIFDSYQQSQPYSESQEWLLKLIGSIHKSLFLITGREELQWEDNDNDIIIYPLKAFPEEAARDFLKTYIPDTETELIETIMESTQCVPIYMDLAVKVYRSELTTSLESIVDKTLFTDRNLLVKQFIGHMPLHWQDVLIYLSVIRIFNQNIFDFIVKDQQLPCPLADYYDIVNISLIDYKEDSGELIKLHDVFCKNGSKILKPEVKLKIFRSYLNYLSTREINYCSKLSLESMVTLFLNVLSLEAHLTKEIPLEVTDWERTLDIFFILYNMKAQFIPPQTSLQYTDDYNDVLYLVGSITHKSISTIKSVQLFESVKNPEIFGKHKNSYLLLWKYAVSLLGKYDEWYSLLLDIKSELGDRDVGEWYDTRTKLYLADYWIMDGSFKKAYEALLVMKDYMASNYLPEDDALLICRCIGHIFRFNLNCSAAATAYLDIFSLIPDSLLTNVYIKTNLCEAYCYFKPEYFNEHFEEIVLMAQQLRHIKNIGKLYYSRAIARTILRDYSGAANDIRESLTINSQDGYQSGELFAYMAQAYLDYAVYGSVSLTTEEKITTLINQNNVYAYFLLPLFIMSDSTEKIEDIRNKFEWLDFDDTLKQYREFFARLRTLEPCS